MSEPEDSSVRLAPSLRDSVVRAKEALHTEREKLKAQHRSGSPGIQVCNHFTDVLDNAITDIFEAAITDLFPKDPSIRNKVALVPHGGYARREMAPYSDVDLMLLHKQGTLAEVSPLSGRLIQDLSDIGVELGFSMRTVRQCCHMSLRDPIICSSLVEARFLAGSNRLFAKLTQKFGRMTRVKSNSLIKIVEAARLEERSKYGEAVHLLEPNVKRSRGGLRDLQLIRWVGFLCHGHTDPDHLCRAGHISQADYNGIRKALDFLLRLRNELHFEAGSARDTLHKTEQMRIAEAFGYTEEENLLAVEKFMRDYFQHTEAVRHTAAHLVENARWRAPWHSTILGYMVSSRADDEILVGPAHITTTKAGQKRVTSDLASILRMMEVANRYDKRIDPPTWEAIRAAMSMKDKPIEINKKAIERFMELLSEPNRLGRSLRRLRQLRVLEKLVPGFDHARCLLQFNEYHKYTVDEHSIRTVEAATSFQDDSSTIGRAYRKITNKSLFHLALLIHDLGKGFPEDHSEVGARIAIKVASHLQLSEEDTETLRFLVHKHLMLSHLAFRRDTSDEELVLKHAIEVGSRQLLRQLFVLTCADFAAVGPGVLNDWKKDVLCRLYRQMAAHLDSSDDASSTNDRVAAIRKELLASANDSSSWMTRQIEELPAAYLQGPSASLLLDDLQRVECLEADQVTAWGRYIEDRKACEYSAAVFEGRVPGIFYRLAGTLSSLGLRILSADIHTTSEGLVLDRFYVVDDDFSECPPDVRFDDVSAALEKALTVETFCQPTFRRTWQTEAEAIPAEFRLQTTKVQIDNSTSETSTIIDVFAHNRNGLLYAISRAIFECKLSVSHAKIGTYIDQVVDVFYVTDQSKRKITDPEQIRDIKQRIFDAIASVDEVAVT